MRPSERFVFVRLGDAVYLSSNDAREFLDGLSGDVNGNQVGDDLKFASRYKRSRADKFFSKGKLTKPGEELLRDISSLALDASRAEAKGDMAELSRLVIEISERAEDLKLDVLRDR